MYNAVCFVIWDHTHTKITSRDLSLRRMDTRGQSETAEAQAENDDQP